MKLKRTHTCGQLRAEDAGTTVTLNGWVASRRDLGGLCFVDLRDRHGITQVNLDPARMAGVEALKPETVVAVRGVVRARPAEAVNAQRSTGAIEVAGDELEILGVSKAPPFEIKDDVEAREETRMRHRYVDMRRPKLAHAMITRSRVGQIIREVFHGEGFVEVETPLLMKTTPEGARDFIVPSRLHPGEVYALPQSPQLFKQTLMICGLDRYFQICKCLRDEDLRADRQPEFTQLDMEMSFVERDDVFRVIEKTMARLWQDVLGRELPERFPQVSWREAMERFGIDKPDTRFGLELIDCSEIARSCGFQVFEGAVASGGSVRAIHVEGGVSSVPRKMIDRLEAVAKEYGAKGLAWMKLAPDGASGPVAKFVGEEARADLIERCGAGPGSLLLFVADADPVVFAALAHVRLTLGRELGLIDATRTDVLWVVDFPLFERDPETGQWAAMHHMFTMPQGGELPEQERLGEVVGELYDLVVNGNEMGSGSIRIHRPELQREVFRRVGIGEEEAEAKFGWFLRALEYGAPPHGGIALGLDRLLMVMLGYDNIRDVIAFPKNASGVCPLTESPSAPIGDALEALGLQPIPRG